MHPAMEALFGFAEDPLLFVRTSVANNVASLAFIFLQSEEIHQAIRSIESDPSLAVGVVRRVGLLLTQQLPSSERHPYDIPIAAYLFVLSRSNAAGLDQALREVRESGLRNLDWAYTMHNWLLGGASRADNQYAATSLRSVDEPISKPSADTGGADEQADTRSSSDRWACAR